MSRRAALAFTLALALGLAGCPRGTPAPGPAAASGATFVDWYPQDISLPAGVEYPCAVTPLPRELVGIPEADRGYVNHACAVIIELLQAKQVLLTAMARGQDATAPLAAYRTSAERGSKRLAGEAVPDGLERFQGAVLEAVALQTTFFEQAVPRRAGGASMEEVHGIPEGRAASGKLMEAWGAIEARYPGWGPAVKDSVYHHLCGLDLF